MRHKSKINRKYGWKPSLPNNAKKYSVCHSTISLPPLVDLRPKDVPIYDQGDIGSCVGNGTAGVINFIQPQVAPSRLFIYYNARVIEGDPQQDGGAEIHDAITSVVKQGVCPESLWEYDTTKFAVEPDEEAYSTAKTDLVTDYFSLQTISDLKQCLASGYPIVFGATVFEELESSEVARSGVLPMPTNPGNPIGGHCMVLVGYNESQNQFIVRNSWGSGWGQKGYLMIPYAYIEQFASDFWTIRADMKVPDNTPVNPSSGSAILV